MPQRLQKILARSGLGSRRACEELIRSGRVQVNGVTAELGQRADRELDEILVDGVSVAPPQDHVYLALYKPVGYLSSLRSQGGKPTIQELVHIHERVYPVGRLDLDSEGLMLLTNDGELTHKLTHPSFGHSKEYRVLLDRIPDRSQVEAWSRGVVLPNGSKTCSARINIEDPRSRNPWVRVQMREGRKRQIRETAHVLGLNVRRLIRVRIGTLELGDLKVGESRRLSQEEVRELRHLI